MKRPGLAFLVIVLLSILLAPLAAEAQQPGKVYRMGIMFGSPQDPPGFDPDKWPDDRAVAQGLREQGYIVGQNLIIEAGPMKGKHEGLEVFAAELVRLKVDLIYLQTCGRRLEVARRATTTIPIVVGTCNDDLVANGTTKSLARPGGNITGISKLTPELTAKRLELLKEVVPRASRVAVLWDPGYTDFASDWRALREAARALGLTLHSVEARGVQAMDTAFDGMLRERPDALITFSDPLVWIGAKRVAELTARHRLPAMYAFREVPDAGGLMAYGPNLVDMWRRSATYVDKILRGASPADLPMEQATKFELVVNLKTAKALNLTIPPSVLARADQVLD
jgi:putative ABC transport system substrate-binding protein